MTLPPTSFTFSYPLDTPKNQLKSGFIQFKMCITSRSRTEWTDEQVVHALDPSTQVVETGRFLDRVSGQPGLYRKTLSCGGRAEQALGKLGQEDHALQGSLCCTVKPSQNKKEKKNRINLNTFHPYKLPKVSYYANSIFFH